MKNTQATLVETVYHHVISHGQEDTFIIGLSGGVDSMVLLDICSQVKKKLLPGVKFLAIHVNHGLNQDADQWESLCRKASLSYRIPFLSESLGMSSSSPNLEANARNQRYDCFIKHSNNGRRPVILGHHQGDLVETFILNLTRGSGLNGLSPMKEKSISQGLIKIRPLLSESKSKLIEYAVSQRLVWVEDPSNACSQYDRNYIRNGIIPEIEKRWPGFSRSVKQSADHLQRDAELLSEVAFEKLLNCLPLGQDCPLIAYQLKNIPLKWQERVVIEWLKLNNIYYFRKTQVEQIVAMSKHNSKSGNDTLIIDGNRIKKFRGYMVIWRPKIILECLSKKLPFKELGSLENFTSESQKTSKKLKSIAPRAAWKALPVTVDSNISYVVDISGKVHKICHNDSSFENS